MKTLQHLGAIAIITIIMGLIYASVQQSYRTAANDPQVELARELKERLQKGESLQNKFSDTFDLASTLSVFVETYDAAGHPTQSNALLGGRLPQLPMGLLAHAKEAGEHWVTWQPRRGIRMAMGILAINTAGPVAYLAVGRSLRLTEERVSNLSFMVIVAWVLCAAVVLFHWLVATYYRKNYKTHPYEQ
jgi:hypothetical protein